MARINTNVPSLIARTNLARANDDLVVRLQRLSTGLRINRGADDPAGLIVSERLRTEMKGLDQARKRRSGPFSPGARGWYSSRQYTFSAVGSGREPRIDQ